MHIQSACCVAVGVRGHSLDEDAKAVVRRVDAAQVAPQRRERLAEWVGMAGSAPAAAHTHTQAGVSG